jgi:hypothetical protein
MSKVKVEMPEGAVKAEDQNNGLSYDDLMQVANRLNAINKELQERLNNAMLGNFFTRLDFLFKVVKYSDKFPESFVKTCIDEICENMTIKEEEDKE